MPPWISSIVFAILVVIFPYTLILRILLQLPKPIVLSHRRWPMAVNLVVMAGITAWVAVFIRSAYYRRGFNPSVALMEFVIAALAYAFGLVLILRQFSGPLSRLLCNNRPVRAGAAENGVSKRRQYRRSCARVWRIAPARENKLRPRRSFDAADAIRTKSLRARKAPVMI
jgi:hypothetical protein